MVYIADDVTFFTSTVIVVIPTVRGISFENEPLARLIEFTRIVESDFSENGCILIDSTAFKTFTL